MTPRPMARRDVWRAHAEQWRAEARALRDHAAAVEARGRAAVAATLRRQADAADRQAAWWEEGTAA